MLVYKLFDLEKFIYKKYKNKKNVYEVEKMKKTFISVLCIVCMLVSSTMVSAGWWSDVFTTGQAGKTEGTIVKVTETVTCAFEGITEKQKCYYQVCSVPKNPKEVTTCTTPQTLCTAYPAKCTKESCPKTGSCSAKITGEKGSVAYWTATCGTNETRQKTLIDGKNERVKFKCEKPKIIKETVTCVFDEAVKAENCYSEKGKCTTDKGDCVCTPNVKDCKCPVPTTCTVNVSRTEDEEDTILWKSSCGGTAKTEIDGKDEKAVFECKPPATSKGALWECYDGYNIKAKYPTAITEAVWRQYADAACAKHCNGEGPSKTIKCGVNSFAMEAEETIDPIMPKKEI